MIIDVLRKFFMEKCPLVRGGNVKINYLSHKPYSFSVSPVGTEEIVKKYADGGSVRQLVFKFALRSVYDEDDSELEAAAVFFEELSKWIEEASDNGTLPELPGDAEPVKLEVVSSGELKKSDTKTARYEMKIRMIYLIK